VAVPGQGGCYAMVTKAMTAALRHPRTCTQHEIEWLHQVRALVVLLCTDW
jgi:hypothetical protein